MELIHKIAFGVILIISGVIAFPLTVMTAKAMGMKLPAALSFLGV